MIKDKREQLRQLNAWWHSSLGQLVIQVETDKLVQTFPSIFGYHLLMLGMVAQFPLVEYSIIPYQSVLNPYGKDNEFAKTITGQWEELPIADNSVDVIVAPHTLEMCEDPLAVISEIYRVLIPEGRLLLYGFNPYSLWRLQSLLRKPQRDIPWCCDFMSLGKVRRELLQLGFQIVHCDHFLFQPPMKNIKSMERLGFLNYLSHFGLKGLGGLYFVEAQKKVRGMRTLKVGKAAAYKKMPVKESMAAPRIINEKFK